MILFSKVILIWLILGVASFSWSWHALHKSENVERVELSIFELSSDLGFSECDCTVILYMVLFLFGFLAIPIVIVRKFLKLLKRK